MIPIPLPKYFGAVAVTVIALQTSLPALAAEGAPIPEAFTAPGLRAVEYRAPRIGDIAPTFALTDSNGRLWNSMDLLAQQSMALVLISEPQRPTEAAPAAVQPIDNAAPGAPQSTLGAASPPAIAAGLNEAAPELFKQNTVVVAVAAGAMFDALAAQLKGKPNIVLLRDATGNTEPSLRAQFGSSESGIHLVAIDRAGFLRSNEAVFDAPLLGASLASVGDPTPKLEVGQRAPDFAIPDMNGRVRRLSDLRGQRNLLLTFFPKCFTGG